MSVQERPSEHTDGESHRHEQPEDWGWHAEMGGIARVAGWIVVASLLLMLIGNHEQNLENIWLVCVAVGLAGVLLWDRRRRRSSWRP